jgi:hypothetical protein
VFQPGNDTQAVLRLVGKFVRQNQFRDAVTIGIPRRHVDHAREISRDHVPFPGRILVPDQLRHAQRHHQQIRFAVFVQIDGDHLIPAFQIAGDHVLDKGGGRPGTGQTRDPEGKNDGAHASV